MKRPFDFKSYRECITITLVFSSLLALSVVITAVLVGASVATVEALMTKMSVPWFVLWYIWCRASSQITITLKVTDEPTPTGSSDTST